MRTTGHSLLVVGCLVAALSIGACGKRAGEQTTHAKAPSVVGPSQAAVRILTPRQGAAVKAHRMATGNLSASVTITGDAEALQTVRVDGHCAAKSCTRIIYTGAEGHWKARLGLLFPRHDRRWTVTVDYAIAPGATTAARVSVAIHAVKARARPRRPSSEPQTSSGTTTERQPSGSQPSPVSPTPSSPAPSGRGRSLVLVGDSLAVGVRALLPAALPGWSVDVLGRVGRPLAEGMDLIDGLQLSAESESARPILAISLFTNDDPTHTQALQAAARRTLELVGEHGCVIWATIARPPVNGVSYEAANALLARLAGGDPRLVIVPWAERVAANAGLLGADGVHPTPTGYEYRARLYADAAQACP
jgi:hypothetical protein